MHLYKILRSGGMSALTKFAHDSLSRGCLVCLLGLFNQFYKQSTASPELQVVVFEQMEHYDLDPNFGDLAPILLQIIETIADVVEISSVPMKKQAGVANDSINTSSNSLLDGKSIDAAEGARKTNSGQNIDSRNVFNSANTNGASLSIEGRIVENSMELLVSIVSSRPEVFENIYNSSVVSGAVFKGLLSCTDASVRTRMGSGLNRICLLSDSSKPNLFILNLLLEYLDLITKEKNMKYALQSQEYFMLFEELLKRSRNLDMPSPSVDEGKKETGSSVAGINPADLAHRLSSAIRSCPIVQRGPRATQIHV